MLVPSLAKRHLVIALGFLAVTLMMFVLLSRILPPASPVAPFADSPSRTASSLNGRPDESRFTHRDRTFSFLYPASLTVGEFFDGDAEVIVFQDERRAGEGFQVYITPLDSALVLTPQLIEAELPDIRIRNPQRIELDERAHGIMFEGNNQSFGGESFEVWFSYGPVLYQVTGYAHYAETMKHIMGTWHFSP